MPVPVFDAWAVSAQLPVVQSLQDIGEPDEEPVIAMDAAHYLDQYRFPAKEPLVTALGGFPMNLESVIIKDIREIESFGCKTSFFFNGLDYGPDDEPFGPSMEAMSMNTKAFGVYENGDSFGAVDDFKLTAFPDMPTLSSFLKTVLHKHGIPFVVAPFRAHAQMIYHLGQNAVDALFGSSELLLFGAQRVITKFSLVHETIEVASKAGSTQKKSILKQEASTFTWIEAEQCLKMLGNITPELFANALFLAGSPHLETFPPLKDSLQFPQSFTFRTVVDLLQSFAGNVFNLCSNYPQDARMVQINWVDRYMRAVQAVRHMIVLMRHDLVKPRSFETLERSARPPSDLHELIGLALPEELQYYMYRGLIGPRVLGWLISGRIKIAAPHAGGESKVYRKLVGEQLQPLRRQALSLLAYSINRYYQQREITTSFWFDLENDVKFNIKDFSLPRKELLSWRVSHETYRDRANELKSKSPSHGPGSLYFAVRSLASPDFVASTHGAGSESAKSGPQEPLVTAEEIVSNVLWRFLYLREYIDERHQLTPWGELLLTVLSKLDSTKEQAEAALTGVELLRFGALNSEEMFQGYGGAPIRGSDTDKSNCLLLSRLACNGKMLHPSKGYSGPLSRHLLAYQSLVSVTRSSLRDLIEMSLAVLFLEGHAERIREDFLDIAEMLPFRDDFSAGLGILTKTYLDEFGSLSRPIDASQRQNIMDRAELWLVHTNVSGSFKLSCELWDAVFAGVRTAGDNCVDFQTRRHWESVDQWFKACR